MKVAAALARTGRECKYGKLPVVAPVVRHDFLDQSVVPDQLGLPVLVTRGCWAARMLPKWAARGRDFEGGFPRGAEGLQHILEPDWKRTSLA